MESQRETSPWQDLLRQLIEDGRERQRLATAMRVRPITLQRWASGISKPRPENMRTLLKFLSPETYPVFLSLLSEDFPHLLQDEAVFEQIHPELPSEFYARVLSAYALTPQPMYRQTQQDLVLQQALEQLDPARLGMSISLVCCVPPRVGRKVRSLREIGGLGTPPWKHDLEQKTIFLGAESLVGIAITRGHRVLVNSREEHTFAPVHWTEYEQSAVAFPICRYGRVAGGLLAASAVPHYFTEVHLSLLERYSHLASLIFEPEEFFDLADLDLQLLPEYELQVPYFLDFNRRVSQKFTEALAQGSHISLQEARLLVWQEIEEELLQVFLRNADGQ
jgi:hypothetical protein